MTLWKLNELEVTKQYHTDITNSCSALENLRDGEDINAAWEIVKGIQTSAKKCV